MNVRTTLASLSLLLVASAVGCAGKTEPGPSANHPASPTAAEAASPKPSTALPGGGAAAHPVADADGAAHGTAAAAGPTAPGGGSDALATPTAYTCAHHPRVMEAEPGECPLCGMPLEATVSKQTSPLRERNDLPTADEPAADDDEGSDGDGDAKDDAAEHEHEGHG